MNKSNNYSKNEFDGKRYTTIVHTRAVTNLITGEETKFSNTYGVYDNENKCELIIPDFHPLCYDAVRNKAIELNLNLNK